MSELGEELLSWEDLEEGMMIDVCPLSQELWISVVVDSLSESDALLAKRLGSNYVGLRLTRVQGRETPFEGLERGILFKIRKTDLEKLKRRIIEVNDVPSGRVN